MIHPCQAAYNLRDGTFYIKFVVFGNQIILCFLLFYHNVFLLSFQSFCFNFQSTFFILFFINTFYILFHIILDLWFMDNFFHYMLFSQNFLKLLLIDISTFFEEIRKCSTYYKCLVEYKRRFSLHRICSRQGRIFLLLQIIYFC